MAESDFDLSGLVDRINEIKKEGEETSSFTLEFLECLLTRHDLKSALPENFQVEDIPQTIIESLRQGELPTHEQIVVIDNDDQNSLICELIWLCGMYSISCYTTNESDEKEGKPTYFESVLAMLDVSAGHFIGCYLIAVLTLLLGKVPNIELAAILTNDFDDTPERVIKSQELFAELAAGILLRWKEDKMYYPPSTNPITE